MSTATSAPTVPTVVQPYVPPASNILNSVGSLTAIALIVAAGLLMLIYVFYRVHLQRTRSKDLLNFAAAASSAPNAPKSYRRSNRLSKKRKIHPVTRPIRQPSSLTGSSKASPITLIDIESQEPTAIIPYSNPEVVAFGINAESRVKRKEIQTPKNQHFRNLTSQSEPTKKRRKLSYDESELLNYFGGEGGPSPAVDFTEFQQIYATIKRPFTASSTESDSHLWPPNR